MANTHKGYTTFEVQFVRYYGDPTKPNTNIVVSFGRFLPKEFVIARELFNGRGNNLTPGQTIVVKGNPNTPAVSQVLRVHAKPR